MIAAIFDLDGTLIDGSILQGLIQHHRAHRIKRIPLYFYVATHFLMWPGFKLGLIPEAWVRARWTENMGWALRGWTPEQAGRAFHWIAEEYVTPRVNPEILARVRRHQEAGHRVILVSGTLTPLLEIISQQFDIPEIVGTPLILRNGIYTGASEPPACQGSDKVTRLKMHLGNDAEIDWAESYAYADSHTDIPLLASFGHPAAVNPDPRLAEHATQNGWDIIRLERNEDG